MMTRSAAFVLPFTLALALPVAAQRLIALDSARVLYEVDVLTAARTMLGTMPTAVGTSGGLAYDAASGKLYVSSTGNDSLWVVDMSNWSATLVGSYGSSVIVMHGLEWDSSTGTLYGMSSNHGGLYTIDTATGAATLVGSHGLGTSFGNLGYDVVANVMYMTYSGTDSLYTLDRATGAATLIGPMSGPTNPHGLAYNIDNGSLYLVCSNTHALYTLDVTTGLATPVGTPLPQGNYLGLAYVPGTGRLTRAVHGCGPTTIRVTGHPAPGSTFVTEVGGATGFPLVGYGIAALGLPFCGCTVGHDWLLANAAVGGSDSLTVPPNPAFVGVQIHVQGLDLFGAGGCADPLLTLTDTITITL